VSDTVFSSIDRDATRRAGTAGPLSLPSMHGRTAPMDAEDAPSRLAPEALRTALPALLPDED
jgi:hypothetical protein